MRRFTPFGVLVLFGFVGVVTGKFGLWFPIGIVAAILVGVAQARSAKPAPSAPDEDATEV